LEENKEWLKGAKWILGEDRERWEARLAEVKSWHDSCAMKEESGTIKYDPLVWDCLVASFDKLSWENY
jgi:hypothetical protein